MRHLEWQVVTGDYNPCNNSLYRPPFFYVQPSIALLARLASLSSLSDRQNGFFFALCSVDDGGSGGVGPTSGRRVKSALPPSADECAPSTGPTQRR